MSKDWISTSVLYGPHLAHHGIKGQKWGFRRYQNPDGTLTEEGKRRYGTSDNFNRIIKGKDLNTQETRQRSKIIKQYNKDYKKNWYVAYNRAVAIFNNNIEDLNKKWSEIFEGYDDWSESPKYGQYVEYTQKLLNDLHQAEVDELFGKIE